MTRSDKTSLIAEQYTCLWNIYIISFDCDRWVLVCLIKFLGISGLHIRMMKF